MLINNLESAQIQHKTNNKEIKELQKVSKKHLSNSKLRLINESIQALVNTSTKRAAAKSLGISEAALYKRLSQYPQIKKGVDSFVDSVKEDMRRKIVLTSPKAVNKVKDLIDNAKSESVQLQASQDILDRAGIVKPKEDTTSVQVNVLNKLEKINKDFDL